MMFFHHFSKLQRTPASASRLRRGRFGVMILGLVSLLLATAPLQSGEKLNIFGAKTRQEPGSEKNAGQKRQDALSGLSRANSPYAPRKARPRARNPKLERQLQNARDEAENWALLEPGQLQEDDDTAQYSGQRRGYLFYGMDKANASQNSGDRSATDAQRAQAQSEATQAYQRQNNVSEDRSIQINPFTGQAAAGNPSAGSHMASGLNFRSLVDPSQTTAGIANQSADSAKSTGLSMKELLGGTSKSVGLASEPSGRIGSYSTQPGGLGLASPINQSPDLTGLSMNPVTSSSRNLSQGSLLNSSPSGRSSLGSLRGSLSSPNSQSSFRQPSVSGFSTLPSPAMQSRRPSLMQDFSSPSRAPRRNF